MTPEELLLNNGQDLSMAQMMQTFMEGKDISPKKRQIIEAMLAQSQSQEDEIADEDYDDVLDAEYVDVSPDDDHIELLRAADQRIEELEDILASIGEALGACTTCFGADDGCDECEGNGTPGFFAPRRDAFEFFVLPVVNRMKTRRKIAANKGGGCSIKSHPESNQKERLIWTLK